MMETEKNKTCKYHSSRQGGLIIKRYGSKYNKQNIQKSHIPPSLRITHYQFSMETGDTPSSIRRLKVTELREKCQELGLDIKGTKQILVDRIMSHKGFSADDIREMSALEDSTNVNDELESKLDLMNEKATLLLNIAPQSPKNTSASPENRFDLNVSDSEKQEVELDFVNEDLQEPPSPNIEIPKDQQSVEDWDESEDFITNPKKIVPIYNPLNETNVKPMVVDSAHEYTVKYMEHTHLDPYVNDLYLQIDDDRYLCGSNLTNNAFSNFWCGVKATHGVSNGAACFLTTYIANITTDAKGNSANGLCVGFSALESSLHLGDSTLSFGYCSDGNIISDGKILATFQKFGVGDRISANINITELSITFSFHVNERDIGHSSSIDLKSPVTLFPHIYFKNCKFQVDFCTPSYQHPSFDSLKKKLISGPKPPLEFSDCELIMMVGIMASGKSTWVHTFSSSSAKRYDIIGRSIMFDRWRQIGQDRREHLSERLVSQALSKLISIAHTRPRNYIIDQTNYISSTRIKRLDGFKRFGLRKAVLVLPRLSQHALRVDSYKKSTTDPCADNRYIHPDEVAEFKANITLPTIDEGFTEVIYVDCDEKSAIEILADYKYDAKKYKELRASKKEDTEKKRPRILPPINYDFKPIKRAYSPRKEQKRDSPIKRHLSPRRQYRESPPRKVSRISPRLRSDMYKNVGKSQFERPSRNLSDSRMRERSPANRPYYQDFKPPYTRDHFERPPRDNHRSEFVTSSRTLQDGPKNYGRSTNPPYSYTGRSSYASHQNLRTTTWNNNTTIQDRREQPRTYPTTYENRYDNQGYQGGRNSRNTYPSGGTGYSKSSSHY